MIDPIPSLLRRCNLAVATVVSMILAVLFGAPATAAEIFWASDPVKPGEIVLVIGEDFGAKPRVSVKRVSPGDGSPSSRSRILETSQLLSYSSQSLAFELPQDLAAGTFEILVEGIGKRARRFLNAPVIYWVQGNLGTAASPGGRVSVFGRAMMAEGKVARLTMRHMATGGSISLTSKSGDVWEARFALPDDLPNGSYLLTLDNGIGSAETQADAGTLLIRRQAPKPVEVFNVRDCGAIGNGATNDSAAILRCIAQAGSKGGTVYLPAGRYRLTAGLELPRYVTLAGESREATALMFDDFASPPDALISGRSHFTVRDLTIFASNHKSIIAGIDHAQPDAEKGHVAIERVRIRAINVRGHITPDKIASIYQKSLKFEHDTLRFGGPNLRIVDSDLLGSGRSLVLYDARGALVSGNTIYNGRIGWYSLNGPDGVIMQNNRIIGADLMSTGGGPNVHYGRAFSRNVIFRNNRFERLFGWDREAITSDGGGGYFYGQVVAIEQHRLRLVGETNDKWARLVPDWRGAGVFILGGRGRGQWARITSLNGSSVTLDRPLAVLPDATSVVTVTQLQQNYLFINNRFVDVGSAIQFYGTSVDHVAVGNRATRSFGFLASGRWYRHYQPSWFCQFIDNEVTDGNIYRSGPNAAFNGKLARIALWGLQKAPNKTPLLIGGVLRRNRLRNGSFIEIQGGSDSGAPGVSDVIVEYFKTGSEFPDVNLDKGVERTIVRPIERH